MRVGLLIKKASRWRKCAARREMETIGEEDKELLFIGDTLETV